MTDDAHKEDGSQVRTSDIFEADGNQVRTSDIFEWDPVHPDSRPPGREPDALATALPPSLNPRYHRLQVLGKGGMGEVYLCKDEIIGREVAMKIALQKSESADDLKRRFVQEAQVQGQLQHPGIVPVYDIGILPDNNVFFTMKRLRGRSLAEILAGLRAGDPGIVGHFPLFRLLLAFASACIAVDYAHTQGVIHRDIKPGNIMLGDFEEVYILDWGLAKLESAPDNPSQTLELPLIESKSAPHTAMGLLMGTPAYMAPEQAGAERSPVSRRSDIFALGAILFEILTLLRLRPHQPLNEMVLSMREAVEARPSVRAPEREVAPELEAICVRATRLRPAERFQTARELYNAIQGFLGGERDQEMRRQLALRHLSDAEITALAAMGEGADAVEARRQTLRLLGRALALDPENREALRLFHHLLRDLPKQIPSEVAEWLSAQRQEKERGWHLTYVRTSWAGLLLIPIFLLMGVRQAGFLVAWIILLTGGWWLHRRMLARLSTPPGYRVVLHVVQLTLFGLMARLFGPLIMITTPITIAAVVEGSLFLGRRYRLFIVASTALLPFVVLGLEWTGLLAPSYAFREGAMIILPTAVSLPVGPTLAFLLSVMLICLIGPSFGMTKMSEDQEAMQRLMILQDWHLRQLLPEPERPLGAWSDDIRQALGSQSVEVRKPSKWW